jgi:hypothetical protein
MARLWIVHREPRWRDALVTMAGSLDVLAGDPTDAARFDAAHPPRAVLLGVAGDFEAELEFTGDAYFRGERKAGAHVQVYGEVEYITEGGGWRVLRMAIYDR